MHVMFLYASTGSGHFKAAGYVRDALLKQNRETIVSMADVLNLCHFPVKSFILNRFKQLISKCPSVYRFLYRLTENNAWFNRVAAIFFSGSIQLLKERCVAEKVQVLVCTHPLALLFASRLNREMKESCPVTMGIITDYQIHRFWLYPYIDLYCVPNKEMKEELMILGWHHDKVRVTGVPCPLDLSSAGEEATTAPFWLLSGGGWGLGNLEATTRCLLKKHKHCNLLVVTGENRSLYLRLKALEEKNPGRLKVMGTIPHLFNTMKNALAVLTKPGGLTVTEAMILKKPLILLKPLPGAEEKNLKYLVKHNAAIPYHSFMEKPEIINFWQDYHSIHQATTARSDSSCLIAQWILEEGSR
jgi:processive 1,2-diacylglycerol beta-glucosyltransferase